MLAGAVTTEYLIMANMMDQANTINIGIQRFTFLSFLLQQFLKNIFQSEWRRLSPARGDKLLRFRRDFLAALYDLFTSDSLQAALTALYAKLLVILGQLFIGVLVTA